MNIDHKRTNGKYGNAFKLIKFFFPKLISHKELEILNLKRIKLPEVTVDGSTCIFLEKITQNNSERWTHRFGDNPLLQPVKESIKNLVITEVNEVEEFDFCNLQTFSASKSFSMNEDDQSKWWVASKHKDALTWGMNLREGSNLKFTTDEDFKENIRHLEFEGIGSRGTIRVFIYQWHNNRVYWANSGGSHHAAALIRQCHTQNRRFTCKAEITRYSLNIAQLNVVRKDFHLLIIKEHDCNNFPVMLAFHYIGILFSTLHFNLPLNHDCKLVAIPRKQKEISNHNLSVWIDCQIKKGTIIDFIQMANLLTKQNAQ